MSQSYCVECGREMTWRGAPHFDLVCPRHGHTSIAQRRPEPDPDYPADTQTPDMFGEWE